MATQLSYSWRAQAFPLALIGQAIPKLTRHELEALTERLIEQLDEVDGDPDMEDDDPSGQCDEDGINTGRVYFAHGGTILYGAGCPISDDDCEAAAL